MTSHLKIDFVSDVSCPWCAIGLASLGMMLSPRLMVASALRLAEAATRYSFNKTGMELLYLPLPTDLKNRTKAFVDIFVDRFGRGVGAMVLAVAGTLLYPHIVAYHWILIAMVAGTLVGVPLSWVPLTAVPQRTALSHAFGGLAAGLVGTAKYAIWLQDGELTAFRTLAIVVEVILGFLTFTGSLMAAGKLQEIKWIPQRPVTYKFQNESNLGLLALAGCSKGPSTDELIEDLSSADDGDRIKAVRWLQHRQGDAPKVVPAMIESLKDVDPDVRWSAAIGLGYFGGEAESALPALEEAKNDTDARVREGARVAISRIALNK
jgi:hypothetical protein